MDSPSIKPPDYHRCIYCKNAFVDGSPELVLRGPNFPVPVGRPQDFWPVLRLSVSDAQKAYEGECGLFRPFRINGSLSWTICPHSDNSVQVCMNYLRHGRTVNNLYLVIWSEPSKQIIGESFSPGTDIFAPQGSLLSKWILPPPHGDFRSQTSLNFVRECLSDCLKEHKMCNQHENLQQPSRLLDLDPPSSRHDTITLVTPEERPPFAALSYCWGADFGFQTTLSTLTHVQSGLKLEEIPQTIRDAVFVTRELGLRYLWVDRLCIVQDNVEEFSVEMTKMGDIYYGARVTISAGNAAASEEGFLHPRSSHLPIPLELPFRCPTGEMSTVMIIPSQSQTELINTRAWTLQESLLSQRLIFYGSRQLEWSCRTVSKANGGYPTPELTGVARSKSTSPLKVAHFIFPPLAENLSRIAKIQHHLSYPKGRVRTMWRRLIENYTKRNLSYPRDKLVAISALAMHVNATLKDKYLAGLWQRNLETQLLWESQDPATAFRATDYIAPSWSWASLEGQIFTIYRTETKVQILGCEVIPVSPDASYGAVSSGYLRIRGQTVNGLFQLAHHGAWTIHKPDSDMTNNFHPDTNELFQEAGVVMSNKMACLTLLLVVESRERFRTSQFGLVLFEDRSVGTYRRIGTFYSHLHSNRERHYPRRSFWTENVQLRNITIV